MAANIIIIAEQAKLTCNIAAAKNYNNFCNDTIFCIGASNKLYKIPSKHAMSFIHVLIINH